MKRVNVLIAVVVLGALTSGAEGELITVGVEGVVQRSQLEGISPGDVMTGYCVYDTSNPDTQPDAYRGVYELESLVMTVEDYRFEYVPGSNEKAWFSVWAVDITYVAETNRGLMLRNNDPIGPSTLPLRLINLCNSSSTGPDAFPLSFHDIDFFSRNEWYVGPGWEGIVSGKLTAIGIIPEPASVCLLLVGAICLRKRVGRNQQCVG